MKCLKSGGVATLVFVAAAAVSSPAAEAASVTVEAPEFLFLPDYNPYVTSTLACINGVNSSGTWAEGIPFVGSGLPNTIGSELAESDVNEYLALGNEGCEVSDGGFGNGTCSDQVISAGSLDFTVAADDNPGLFPDSIVFNGVNLTFTGASFSGSDGVFELDAASFPTVIDGDSFAFDLLFTGIEPGDYAATLTLTTDRGREIPFDITSTVTGVPTPSAAAAGLALLGRMTGRRRRAA